MKTKQLVGTLLAASLFLTNPVMVWAEEKIETAKVLTIEQAIKNATNASITLRQNERAETLKQEEYDMTRLTGDYYAAEQKKLDVTYTQLQRDIIKEQLERSLYQAFDDILYTEQTIATLEKKISLQEKEIERIESMRSLGFASNYSLEQVKLELSQAKSNKRQLEQSLEVKYASLCNLMGQGSTTKYALQKQDNIFEPFELTMTLDRYATKKAQDDLSYWRATEEASIAENPIFTYDYMAIIRKREERAAAADTVKTTKEQIEQKVKDTYAQVKQLEARYEVAISNLKIKEKELQISGLKLENGTISAFEHEKAVVAYETSKEEIDKIVMDHTYLKQVLEKPYLS